MRAWTPLLGLLLTAGLAAGSPPVSATDVLAVVTSRENATRETGGPESSSQCYVSPLAAAKSAERGRITIVDVRKREDFSRYRIRGSLNIPSYAIKTKSFLRVKPIVLVNEGRTYHSLEKVCTELAAKGFADVKILQGGLHAWREKVGPMDGDPVAQSELSIVDPKELFEAVYERRWLVVDVSAEGVPAMEELPDVITIPAALGSEGFVEHLSLAVSRRTEENGQGPDVLIMDRAGEQYETFTARIDSGSLRGAFYLRGGASGYRAYLAMQEAMWGRKAKPPKRRSSCTLPR